MLLDMVLLSNIVFKEGLLVNSLIFRCMPHFTGLESEACKMNKSPNLKIQPIKYKITA